MDEHGTLGFAEQARLGRTGIGRYLLALLLIVALGAGLFAAFLFALDLVWRLSGEPSRMLSTVMRAPPARWDEVPRLARLLFMLVNLGFIAVWFFAIWAALAWVHRRPLRTALTAAGRFRWRHLLASFGIMVGLSLGALALDGLFWEEGLQLSFEPRTFFYMLPWILVALVVQVAAEELAFRGYLLQALRLLLPAPLVWLLVSAAFALLHGFNPEVAKQPLALVYFFLIGGYLTALVFRGDGLETALGVHLAANVLALVVIGNNLSNYPVSTIFYAADTDLAATLFSTVVVLALHWALLHGALRLDRR